MDIRVLDAKSKALEINLDKTTYGSLAEIGAGQEVAALLFKAGAASQTIAKSISAYDMTFSDAIYGKEDNGRYVCESRLNKMLNREFSLLESRLKEVRPQDTQFFAFADTVVTTNFQKTNQGHGWLGVRFQHKAGELPSDLIVHMRLMEKDASANQVAVGIFGINMLYGCFYFWRTPELLLESLMDNLNVEKVKIDMIRFSGPAFEGVDNRIMALQLVQKGFTNAALFDPNGEVKEPQDVFYKKHILAVRGRFRPCTHVNMDMMHAGYDSFISEADVNKDLVIDVAELTLANLSAGGEIDYKDFLDRADILCSLGKYVLVSNYQEYYRLVDYFSRFTKLKIGIILGPDNLAEIFTEEYYRKLKGGILESFAALFSRNVKLFVYPSKRNDELRTTVNFMVSKELEFLYKYLVENGKIKDVSHFNDAILGIFSDEVIRMIHSQEKGWEAMVPMPVEKAIKEKKLFGYGS